MREWAVSFMQKRAGPVCRRPWVYFLAPHAPVSSTVCNLCWKHCFGGKGLWQFKGWLKSCKTFKGAVSSVVWKADITDNSFGAEISICLLNCSQVLKLTWNQNSNCWDCHHSFKSLKSVILEHHQEWCLSSKSAHLNPVHLGLGSSSVPAPCVVINAVLGWQLCFWQSSLLLNLLLPVLPLSFKFRTQTHNLSFGISTTRLVQWQ